MSADAEQIERIIMAVAAEFNVDPMSIVNPERGGLFVSEARQVTALMLKDKMSSSDLGSLLGKRGHQYPAGAVKAVTRRAMTDYAYMKRVLRLADRFSVKWLCSS